MRATPLGVPPGGARSAAVKVNVTGSLFQPAAFGAGLTLRLTSGGAVSRVPPVVVVGRGVAVGAAVGTEVEVAVLVGTAVAVGVSVGTAVGMGVSVGTGV